MEAGFLALLIAAAFVLVMMRQARRRREAGKTPGRSTQAGDDRGGDTGDGGGD